MFLLLIACTVNTFGVSSIYFVYVITRKHKFFDFIEEFDLFRSLSCECALVDKVTKLLIGNTKSSVYPAVHLKLLQSEILASIQVHICKENK